MAKYVPLPPAARPVVIELTADEAAWLLSVLQNPIGCEPPSEPPRDRQFRGEIWNALHAGMSD